MFNKNTPDVVKELKGQTQKMTVHELTPFWLSARNLHSSLCLLYVLDRSCMCLGEKQRQHEMLE